MVSFLLDQFEEIIENYIAIWKINRENTALALILITMILGYNSTFAMNTFIGFSKENVLLGKTE